MGLSQSLFSGISGLVNHQTRMDNIGNNLANVNTVGYKKSVLLFSDLISQTLNGGTRSDAAAGRSGTNPRQVGLGMQVASIVQDFSQGALETTGKKSDLAIDGNGFFIVAQGSANDVIRYTRDGSFKLGDDNMLINSTGYRVLGTLRTATGSVPRPDASNLQPLEINMGVFGGGKATTQISFSGNLNADGQVATTGTRTFSAQLFTQVADGSDAAVDASVAAVGVGFADLTINNSSTLQVGDSIWLGGGGLVSGLYTVGQVDPLGVGSNSVRITSGPTDPSTLVAGTAGITARTAADDNSALIPTRQVTGGKIGGIYEENGNLLLSNWDPTSNPNPTLDLAALKGNRQITETFL